MPSDPKIQLPQIPLRLFTLDPSQIGGRNARRGYEFQDQYIASVLARLLAGEEDFLAARIEGVEDLELITRSGDAWLERYYQIKSRQEGGTRWTVAALHREGIWIRFFMLFQLFVTQKFEETRRIEFVIAVEGDLDPDLLELRERGADASSVKAKLLDILANPPNGTSEGPLQGLIGKDRIADALIDGFISTLRFESRLGNLPEITFSRLINAGDLSPDEARTAHAQLIGSIRDEYLRSEATLITPQMLRSWLGVRERSILQKKPAREPCEVERDGLITNLVTHLVEANSLLLYGTPKVGKSHLISALLDHLHKEHDYFWFTFTGTEGDRDKFVFQLASWVGDRTGIRQLKDDIQSGSLQVSECLVRLKMMPVSDVHLILDDCHKLINKGLLEELTKLIADGWSGARIVLISEEKIPELRAAGIKELHVTGLEPKEGIFFLARLGVEVGGALVELAMLCVQADGHPAMLRAIASELPSRPSPEDVKKLSQSLHTALSVKPFVDVLSERLIKSWRSDSHRQWVMRLAVLAFPFRSDLAMRIAELEPKIVVTTADWNYLSSQLLDQSGADQYTVPALLRPLLTSPGQQPGAKEILIASARYVFRTASASNRMDFWDFHGAILALVLAQRYDEAAMYFLMSLKASMQLASFTYFEILFMVLNSDVIQEKLKDAFPKFTLLSCELQMRLQLEPFPDYTRIMDLLRRMRLLTRVEIAGKPLLYDRIQIHQAIAAIRLRRIMEKKSFDTREGRRAFVPIQAALRLAVAETDSDLTRLAVRMYIDLHFLGKQPDLEVLKEAILMIPERSLRAYGGKVVSLYTNFVISKKYDDSSLVLCERHSREYRQAGRGNAFFACEHAAATILFDRFSEFKEARNRIVSASTAALQIGASPHVVARTNLFVADSYWAEKNYVSSAEYYEKAASADLGDEALNQWTREKLADSLIFMGHFEKAALGLVETLRERHSSLSPTYKSRYYARLAYAYAECDSLRKASVACQSLSRVARQSGIGEIDRLSAIVSGWVLQRFKYSDPGLPRGTVSIRDSSALSEQPSPEEMNAWKDSGPAFTRGLMLVGTLFELLGEYRRSENIYHRAIATYRCSDKDPSGLAGGEYTFQLRIARVQVRRHNVYQAAETFRLAAEGLFELRNQDVPGSSIGASVFASATIVEPCLESCPDSEVMEFFVEVEKRFAAQSGARAWLLFKQSEILFGRLMVQAAKRTLLDAEVAARSCDEYELLWSILYSKLFSHIDQIYRNQFAWITDALETGLSLAKDERLAVQRSQFGEAVFRLTSRIVPPMGDIGNAITKFGDRAKKDPFLFAMLAIWRVAKTNRLTTQHLPEVEQVLRNNVALVAADFEQL